MTLCSLIGRNLLPQKPQIPLQMHLRWSQCTCDIHGANQEYSIFTVLQRMNHGKLSLKYCKKYPSSTVSHKRSTYWRAENCLITGSKMDKIKY
jgi:hypothetical protein